MALTFIFILIFIDCILLTSVVLVQESKGGGLASGFSSANQMIGVKRTTEFLEKATWFLAIALLVLCLGAAALGGKTQEVEVESKSSIQEYIDNETIIAPQPQQQQQPQQEAPAQ
ncbi:MAG: preprotein translocase subunit SecG [Salibacteraceae bacterium]